MIKLINKLPLLGLSPKATESFLEAVDLITRLRDTRAEISVLFDRADYPFDSAVLGASPKHRVMVIEAPHEALPQALLSRGRPITVTTSTHGREISFRSRFLEPFTPDSSLGYQIEMPGFLGMEQPRGALRILLDELRCHASITLEDSRKNLIEGVVKNISRSGVGMKTENRSAAGNTSISERVNCSIDIEDVDTINCQMEIRNVQRHENGTDSTYLGGQVTAISRRDSHRLASFIAHLQRLRLQALVNAA